GSTSSKRGGTSAPRGDPQGGGRSGAQLPRHAHITLLCESQIGYANLCRILTHAHAGTRVPGRERELLPPATTLDVLEAHAEGLVCLSGCARHGLATLDPNAAARLARAFPGAFYVELQRPYERGDARRNAVLAELARDLGVP